MTLCALCHSNPVNWTTYQLCGECVALAIADRNGNRQDRETGLGPKDESGGAGNGNRPNAVRKVA